MVVGAGFMGSGIAESAARAGLDVVALRAGGRRRSSRSRDAHRDVGRPRRRAAGSWPRTTPRRCSSASPGRRRPRRPGRRRPRRRGDRRGPAGQGRAVPHARRAARPRTRSSPRTPRRSRSPSSRRGRSARARARPALLLAGAGDEARRGRRRARHRPPRSSSAPRRSSRAIGKHPIRTKDRSGFIVNMLLVPYLMAAVRMYEDGFATREDIDEGMKLGAGHPMGPLTLCDFIGLDVLYAVCDSLYEEFKRPEYAPPPLLKRMVVSGHHGRKTGRGFYEYAAQPAEVSAASALTPFSKSPASCAAGAAVSDSGSSSARVQRRGAEALVVEHLGRLLGRPRVRVSVIARASCGGRARAARRSTKPEPLEPVDGVGDARAVDLQPHRPSCPAAARRCGCSRGASAPRSAGRSARTAQQRR